jgi:hypothetical protein
MKSSLFAEWRHSNGANRKWTALAAAAAISCFPVASVFADNHGHGGGGHGGGGHPSGGGGHPGGGGHGGGAPHMAGGGGHGGGGGNPGGGSHGGGAPHMVSSGNRGGGGHGGSPHFDAGGQPQTSGGHSGGSHNFANAHSGTHSHEAAGHQNHSASSNTGKSFAKQNRSNGAAELRAITQEKRTNTRITNKTVVNENNSRTRSLAETQRIVHQNNGERLKNRALFVNRTSSFDRSVTRTRAQGLLNRRLNQISRRTWSGRGQFYANHFDPGNHCWYRHGSYWWRCNYWGAHAYCNRLIVLGFAPGLCWDWYDDICWGNIAAGMPLDLVEYYYPDPVYTGYTTWDGEDATVYYYAAEGGQQYKRVTVVDGDVVDVQIVDEIAYS